MKRRLIALLVSLGLLAALYWKIDPNALAQAFARSDVGLLVLALSLVAPTTLISGWRFSYLAPRAANVSVWEGLWLILMSNVLNLILPSKMGDIAKAYVLVERGKMTGAAALTLVAMEKGWDFVALLVWCALGLQLLWGSGPHIPLLALMVGGLLTFFLLMLGSTKMSGRIFALLHLIAPAKIKRQLAGLKEAWAEGLGNFWANPAKASILISVSVWLWLIHLVQIWLLAYALSPLVPLLESFALSAVGILAGLLPFTLAGIGTRDAALIVLYSPYMDAGAGAALGLLCTLRYLIPAAVGLPFWDAIFSRPNCWSLGESKRESATQTVAGRFLAAGCHSRLARPDAGLVHALGGARRCATVSVLDAPLGRWGAVSQRSDRRLFPAGHARPVRGHL
ncbi:Lysylphosphatidylglycerol synthetase [Rhodospirillaceae bacterium LM-1]|nr:Lysylphosphatidylglycerol synthetase [Rhodospirillaceae bacterium LM-1]